MPQVQFRCPICGSKRLELREVGIARFSTVASMVQDGTYLDAAGPVATMGSYRTQGGCLDGYQCGNDHAIPPTSQKELWEWLQAHHMLSNDYDDSWEDTP